MLPISPLAQPTAASSRLMPPPPTNTDFYAMVQERTLFTKLLLVKQGQCQLQLPIIEAKKKPAGIILNQRRLQASLIHLYQE